MDDTNTTGVLFPSPDSTLLPIATAQHPAPSLKTLIVIDGTWDHAKQMLSSSPLLQALQKFRVQLPLNYRPAFLIRKAPSENSVSTAEAVAIACDSFDHGNRTDAVAKVLKAWSEKQLAMMDVGRVVHRIDRKGYVKGLF